MMNAIYGRDYRFYRDNSIYGRVFFPTTTTIWRDPPIYGVVWYGSSGEAKTRRMVYV